MDAVSTSAAALAQRPQFEPLTPAVRRVSLDETAPVRTSAPEATPYAHKGQMLDLRV